MRRAHNFLTSSQTSMNVLAIQDLSVVCGGGKIQFPLQQLHTMVSWVRHVTFHIYPPKEYVFMEYTGCTILGEVQFVNMKRPYRSQVTRGHMFRTSNIVVSRFRHKLLQGCTLNYGH